jgi:hypothetical protein
MSTLEEALKLAAERGLTHLTLYPVPSADNKITYWHAKATPSTGHNYVQITTTDPVDAVVQVLQALPRAPKRAAAKITATVNEPAAEIDKWLPQA